MATHTLEELNRALDRATTYPEDVALINLRRALVAMEPVSDEDSELRDVSLRLVERLQFQRTVADLL